MLTRTVPWSGCRHAAPMQSETAGGSTTAAAAARIRRRERERRASKTSRLQTSTHSEPPKTPVYSYHCTAHMSCENPLPSTSHGHENSPVVYQYSVEIQAATKVV